MKRLLLLGALSALAACGNHDAQPADTASAVTPPSADSARVADSLKRAADTVKPTASATVVLPEGQLYSFTSRAEAAMAQQRVAVAPAPEPEHSHKRIWVSAIIIVLAAGAAWAYVRRKHRHADTSEYSTSGDSRSYRTGSGSDSGGVSPRNQERT